MTNWADEQMHDAATRNKWSTKRQLAIALEYIWVGIGEGISFQAFLDEIEQGRERV